MRRTYVSILLFWLPLAAMWLMMAVEQPAMNGVIARMPQAKENLAAFGIAFSLALVVESPILQLLSAATALSTDRQNYGTLLRFTVVLSAALTVLHVVVGTKPVFLFVSHGLLSVPLPIAERARSAFVTLFPFSMAVAFRRLWQGVLIKYDKPHLVTLSMVVRLVATVATLWVGFVLFKETDEGHVLGALAVVVGVVVGAVAAYLLFASQVRSSMPAESPAQPITTRELLRFYVPLASTSVLLLASRPLLTFGIARARQPVEALAAWPVVQSYLFLFTSLSISFQEVAVAWTGRSDEMEATIRRFVAAAGTVLSVLFAVVAVTPASRWWFVNVAGLPPDLAILTVIPLYILGLAPFLEMTKATARGVCVARGTTAILAGAVSTSTAILLLSVSLLPLVTSWHGGIVAAVSYVAALVGENGVLFVYRVRVQLSARGKIAGAR